MAGRHFYNDPEALVHLSLRGLLCLNPNLNLIEKDKVIFHKTNGKVTLISGGGSGHEPAHAGFVGRGMLDAAVAGNIFASPSTSQIISAVRSVQSDKGTLLIVKNYTGDVLNFGMAAERLKNEGLKVDLVVVNDDVAVGRTKGGLVGRRGLSGTVLVHKIAGALAEGNLLDLSALVLVVQQVIDNLVTVGASLNHCHVPGRGLDQEDALQEGEMEIGMGIHNEPGVQRIKTPNAPTLVRQLLSTLLDKNDSERTFVKFEAIDEVVLLVNNLGGISNLELNALVYEIYVQLKNDYDICPKRVYSGAYMTALNGPGFSITLLNLSRISSPIPILDLLDSPTESIGWTAAVPTRSWNMQDVNSAIVQQKEGEQAVQSGKDIRIDPQAVERGLLSILEAIKDAEAEITHYDTIAGDGDCGATLHSGAKAIIKALRDGKLNLNGASGLLGSISEIAEDSMGGTSGALYSIYLAALAQGFKKSREDSVDIAVFSKVALDALSSLEKYTPARVGDRTLMDALIPFVETLEKSGNITHAVDAAKAGAQSTKGMAARLGRATYVGDHSGGLPPDPGAVGLSIIIEAYAKGASLH